MECPACHSKLREKTFNHIKVDVCDHCEGIWFDFAEMKGICDSDTLQGVDEAFAGSYWEKAVEKQMAENTRHCPRDGTALTRHEWSVDSKIVMDFCPECCGTWLDAGELEGYTAYLKHLEENPPKATPEQLAEMQRLRDATNEEIRAWMQKHVMTPKRTMRALLLPRSYRLAEGRRKP